MKTRKFKMFNVLYLVCFALFLSLTASFFATSYTSTLSWDAYAEDMVEVSEELYEIYTAEQFAGFSASVNSGTTYAGKTIRVMKNIDFKDKTMTAVGNSSYRFKGTFDGQNSALSNVNITGGGLFYSIENAIIKNVVIDSGTVSTHSSIAKYAYSCKIINCTNRANFLYDYSVGGIVNLADDGTMVKNCMNYANITTSNDVGGIVRLLTDYSTIENCINFGTIRTTGSGYNAGGIVGAVNEHSIVKNCSNFGYVGAGTSYSATLAKAGGIAGNALGSTISNCYNNSSVRVDTKYASNAKVYTGGYAGGIVGYGFDVTINNCYAKGSVYCLSGTYNGGTFDLDYVSEKITDSLTFYFYFRYLESYNVGGIIGNNIDDNTLSNNGYNSTINKTDVTTLIFVGDNYKPTLSEWTIALTFKEDKQYNYFYNNSNISSYYYGKWVDLDRSYSYSNTYFGKDKQFGYDLEKYFSGLRFVYSSDSKTNPINATHKGNNISPMWFTSQYANVWIFRETSVYKNDWVGNSNNKWYSPDYDPIWTGHEIYTQAKKKLLGDFSLEPLTYLGSDWVQHDYAGYVYNKIYW